MAETAPPTIPVILDTDIGTDMADTWALAMLLGCPELDLRLVVATTGDTTYRARLAAGLLSAGGRGDVPVAIGPPTELTTDLPPRPQARFADGIALERHPGGVRADGVAALVECVMESPRPVTIVGIGPMTTIAAALAAEPAVAERARLVAVLGAVATAAPEYNAAADVAACRAVLAAAWEPTIAPLETCGSVMLRRERYAAVRRHGGALLDAVLDNQRDSLRATADWADALDAPARAALTAELERQGVDPQRWLASLADGSSFERRTGPLYDTVAVQLAYDESRLELERLAIAVDDDGRTRVDPGAPTVRAATGWRDAEGFVDHLVTRLTGAQP